VQEAGVGVVASGSNQQAAGPVYLDPAEFSPTRRTPKLRLKVAVIIAGPPGTTLTYGLYPVGAISGGSNMAMTLGTVGVRQHVGDGLASRKHCAAGQLGRLQLPDRRSLRLRRGADGQHGGQLAGACAAAAPDEPRLGPAPPAPGPSLTRTRGGPARSARP
jgi:hypothetical protein